MLVNISNRSTKASSRYAICQLFIRSKHIKDSNSSKCLAFYWKYRSKNKLKTDSIIARVARLTLRMLQALMRLWENPLTAISQPPAYKQHTCVWFDRYKFESLQHIAYGTHKTHKTKYATAHINNKHLLQNVNASEICASDAFKCTGFTKFDYSRLRYNVTIMLNVYTRFLVDTVSFKMFWQYLDKNIKLFMCFECH